jgi:hypothetical protein
MLYRRPKEFLAPRRQQGHRPSFASHPGAARREPGHEPELDHSPSRTRNISHDKGLRADRRQGRTLPPLIGRWTGSARSARRPHWWARPNQGAYAAPNSWLDAFTLWRRAQGLPATAIAWKAWGPIGRATALAEGAGIAIAPDDGAYAF